jgi:hypothetical protein
MKIYRRYFDARSQSRNPVRARLDGEGCWLLHRPLTLVIETASFQAILRNGPSKELTRTFELGKADHYYSSICKGIGENDAINLYSSELEARQDYENAVKRCGRESCWQRV